jgi:hypothetical protein
VTVSLDRYGHLFAGALAITAAQVDAWLGAADTKSRLTQLDEYRVVLPRRPARLLYSDGAIRRICAIRRIDAGSDSFDYADFRPELALTRKWGCGTLATSTMSDKSA